MVSSTQLETLQKPAQFDLDIKKPMASGLRGWFGPLAATVVAAALRLPNLGTPHALVFDETYYAKDALSLLNFGVEKKFVDGANEKLLASDGQNYLDIFLNQPAYVVHPPIGKWIIASGEAIFGATPFGWRIAVAILGILSVLLTARITRRLTNSNFIGTVAGFLLALDGLHIAMSRTALLDTPLSFFVLCAFGALILDRDRKTNESFRYWRWIMIGFLGLAIATKWSGLYFAAAFGLLMLIWDLNRRTKISQWLKKDLLPAILMPFVALAIYIASWVGWFASSDGWARNFAADKNNSFLPDSLISLFQYHKDMWSFHTNLTTAHNYEANPWGWPFLYRPTSFFYDTASICGGPSCSQEVIPLGNPLIWWTGVAALILLLAFAINQRFSAALPIVVGFLAGWAPWLLFTQRTVFHFYSVVFIPFTVMAVAILLYFANLRVQQHKPVYQRWPAIVFMLAALALTIFFYPILVGQSLTYEMWKLRMWFPNWI